MIVLPFWSVSRNGPPIADGAATIGALPRPVTSSTTAKHSTSPARNAESTSSRRMVRGFMLRFADSNHQKQAAMPAAMISKNTAVP